MKRRFTYRCIALTVLVSAFLVIQAQTFSEVADSVGVSGQYGQSIFTGCGGISFVDFNQDGRDDLTFCTELGSEMIFYENAGGQFDLISPPFVSNTDETKQVLWVDFDNDGDLDLFITAFLAPNRLYENNGSMIFADITASAGLPVTNSLTYGANFGDYDRDGLLDLYITNYGQNPSGAPNELYRNNGDGTFTDVTAATNTSNGAQQSFCSTFFDYNNDGVPELYVVNDRHDFPNALYALQDNGTFADMGPASGSDIAVLAMNGGVGDYDNNGYLDIYVTNTYLAGEHCYLLQNHGDGTFTDQSAASGTTFDRFGWGGNFFDYDNDLDLDLYVCSQNFNSIAVPNALYVNQGDSTFTEPLFASNGLGGMDTLNSFVNAIGDFNQDGWPDIAVSHEILDGVDMPFSLWENGESNGNHWAKFTLTGFQSNRDAIGAKITLYVDGQSYIQFTHSSIAYLAQNSRKAHFGLGGNSSIDSVRIDWPSPFSTDIIAGDQVNINDVNFIEESCRGTVVTSSADNGIGSLRKVISCAAIGDTVTFDPGLAGDTIMLTSGPLILTRDIVIQGDSLQPAHIQSMVSGAITVDSSAVVELKNLSVTGCCSTPSGISNHGMLILNNTDITGDFGGNQEAVINHGTLFIRKSSGID